LVVELNFFRWTVQVAVQVTCCIHAVHGCAISGPLCATPGGTYTAMLQAGKSRTASTQCATTQHMSRQPHTTCISWHPSNSNVYWQTLWQTLVHHAHHVCTTTPKQRSTIVIDMWPTCGSQHNTLCLSHFLAFVMQNQPRGQLNIGNLISSSLIVCISMPCFASCRLLPNIKHKTEKLHTIGTTKHHRPTPSWHGSGSMGKYIVSPTGKQTTPVATFVPSSLAVIDTDIGYHGIADNGLPLSST
jgi:hypothetical protein